MQKKIQDPFQVFTKAEGYINEGSSSVDNPGTNCTMILGNTRSGKSTLINYLLGTPLKADVMDPNAVGRARTLLKIMLQNENEVELGPKIGNTVQSETTTPKKYKSTKGPFIDQIFDNPGFGDNRGVAIDISNGALVSKLLTKAKNIRIVLVVDYDNIATQNPALFVSLIKQSNYLFGDIEKLKDCVCMVITKVPIDYDQEAVLQDLQCIAKQITDPEFKKQLLGHIIQKRRIILFQKPARRGPLDCSNAQKITEGIMALKPIPSLDKVQVGISPDSKNYIYQNNMIILDFTKKDLKQFLGYLDKLIDVNAIKTSEQGIAVQNFLASTVHDKINVSKRDPNLKEFVQRLYNVMIQAKINIPQTLLVSIKSKLYLIQFVKKIIELNTMEVDQFKNDTSTALSKLHQSLTTKIYQLQYQEGKIRQEQFKKQLEEQRRRHEEYERQMQVMNEQMRQAQQKHAEQLAKTAADNQRIQQAINKANNQILRLQQQNQRLRNSFDDDDDDGWCNIF